MQTEIEQLLRSAWAMYCSDLMVRREDIKLEDGSYMGTDTSESMSERRKKFREIVPILREAVMKGYRFYNEDNDPEGNKPGISFETFDPGYFLIDRMLMEINLTRGRLTYLKIKHSKIGNTKHSSTTRISGIDYKKGTADGDYILSELSDIITQIEWIERKTYGTSIHELYKQAPGSGQDALPR